MPIPAPHTPVPLPILGLPAHSARRGDRPSYRVLLSWSRRHHAFQESYIPYAWSALYLIAGNDTIPTVHTSTQAVASWRLRKGDPVAVTRRLKNHTGIQLIEDIVTHVLPNMRPHRGVSISGADNNGNFTFPIAQPRVFPALHSHYDDYRSLCSKPGLSVTIQTNQPTRFDTLTLMKYLGLPLIN